MRPKITAQQVIDHFNLLPHPEGGFFREYYRANEMISSSALPERYQQDRSLSTAIYYLLNDDACSKIHRLSTDEIWHFYTGDPLYLIELNSAGKLIEHVLGQEILKGQKLQVMIPAGSWFGACLDDHSDFALVGCTMAPGFDFTELEFGSKVELLKHYPQASQWIERLI